MGIGAATGALIAGPVGLVVGGVVGKLYADQNLIDESKDTGDTAVITADNAVESAKDENDVAVRSAPKIKEGEALEVSDYGDVMVASSANVIPVASFQQSKKSKRIEEIITYDLSMDLYFKPGSVAFEPFYARQLASINNLMETMPELQLNLDGYSDRQGSKEDNLQLSVERLDSVKDYFVSQGIDVSRINLNAHGEKNFLSLPGELESYMFDRRVVVSFDVSSKPTTNSVASLSNYSFL